MTDNQDQKDVEMLVEAIGNDVERYYEKANAIYLNKSTKDFHVDRYEYYKSAFARLKPLLLNAVEMREAIKIALESMRYDILSDEQRKGYSALFKVSGSEVSGGDK